MSNKNSSIHDFDLHLICEYFSGVERQGPGSPDVTLKALSFIDNLAETSEILDVGCGTGGQTITLAEHVPGKITGLDLFPVFIRKFDENARKYGFENRMQGRVGSMDNMPFRVGSFDVLWSEGAIYNIGFERGLNEWRKFLKKGGYLAVTEVSWLTEKRPDEIENFWMDAYPEIDTISNKVKQMQKAGYIPVATFVLPENCWFEHFYAPQVAAKEIFSEKKCR